VTNQGAQPDGWDIWQWGSYAATGLSLLSLMTQGKKSKEISQAGTALGIVSVILQALTVPPRCPRCQCRMARSQSASTSVWACLTCGTQQA
jgi:hypothetical protein